jgi:hypothetical protein
MQLDTVQNGVAHADVREVHAGELLLIRWPLSALALVQGVTPEWDLRKAAPRDCGGASHVRIPPSPRCFFRIGNKTIGATAMTELYPSLVQCAIVAAAFKVLLFPA